MKDSIYINKTSEIYKQIKLLTTKAVDDLYLVNDLFTLSLIKEKDIDIKDCLYMVYSNEMEYRSDAQGIIDYLKKNNVDSYIISKKTIDSLNIKENSCSIFVVIKKNYKSLTELNSNIVIVLDHLENPGNVGTILRTMDACGFKDVILVDEITKPNHPKCIQSSRGTVLLSNIYSDTYENVNQYLLENNYDIYLGEPVEGVSYRDYNYQNKVAIVVGNERYGINELWYAKPHKKVFIPQEGVVSSLNVSIAASILIYEVYMKLKG